MLPRNIQIAVLEVGTFGRQCTFEPEHQPTQFIAGVTWNEDSYLQYLE